MCFTCCMKCKKICSPHAELAKRKEDEERYIEEGIQAAWTRKRRTFIHAEDGLTDVGHTVVVWCLRDFLRNSAWSAPTFAQLDRARLSKKIRLKRRQRRVLSAEEEEKKILEKVRKSVANQREKREKAYTRVRSQWEESFESGGSTVWLVEEQRSS
eukprot:CAMPEP_0185033406 /NCGR_PEP_ID=MMETSP1103-20130426/22329_1 /TAXON_ID=36769 /ORGANISM="Paraphysomonas bandaiensis, Strain Caron Lab Isolate" /LENGTH=155 /DNA_ID=CAMNT_0027569665 /DNA_START=63 /DNA_END=530 /DNA_ORIENTATION=-